MSQMSALSVCIFLLSKNNFLLYQNVVALQVICPFEEHNWPVDSVLMKWNFYDFILSLSLGQMVLHILEHLWGHRGDSRPLDTKMEPKPCHTEKNRQNVNYLAVFFIVHSFFEFCASDYDPNIILVCSVLQISSIIFFLHFWPTKM